MISLPLYIFSNSFLQFELGTRVKGEKKLGQANSDRLHLHHNNDLHPNNDESISILGRSRTPNPSKRQKRASAHYDNFVKAKVRGAVKLCEAQGVDI